MRLLRGQGATEYLSIFAVVLLIALTAMVLMAFFPGLAGDAKTNQSSIYWRGVASPFGISEAMLKYYDAEKSRFYFVMQNKGTDGISLTGGTVAVAGNGTLGTIGDETKSTSFNSFFSPGQEHRQTTDVNAYFIWDFVCTPGQSYELTLSLNYTKGSSWLTQVGARPLTLKCYSA
jgi:hypothetical protein